MLPVCHPPPYVFICPLSMGSLSPGDRWFQSHQVSGGSITPCLLSDQEEVSTKLKCLGQESQVASEMPSSPHWKGSCLHGSFHGGSIFLGTSFWMKSRFSQEEWRLVLTEECSLFYWMSSLWLCHCLSYLLHSLLHLSIFLSAI